jgi:hypothetical protein
MLEVKLENSCSDDGRELLWQTWVHATNRLYRPSLVYELAGCPIVERNIVGSDHYAQELVRFSQFRALLRGPVLRGRARRELWKMR